MPRSITLGVGALFFGLFILGHDRSLGEDCPDNVKEIQKKIENRGGRLICTKTCGGGYSYAVQFVNRDDLSICDELGGNAIDLLSGLTNLTQLDLRMSRVTAELLHSVAKLSSITDLDLSSTRITDADLPILAGMGSLANLRLNYTMVTADGLAGLTNLKRCINLDLVGTKLQKAELKRFEELPLDGLNLSDTEAADDWLPLLPPKLKTLKLARTRVTNEGLKQLGRFDKLYSLDLSGNSISDAGVEAITNESLLELNLQDAKPKSPKGTEGRITSISLRFLKRLAYLTKLDLSGASVSDKALEDFFKNEPCIDELILKRTPVTGVFAKYARHVRKLDLTETLIDKKGLEAIAGGIPGLKELWLESTTGLSDADFVAVIEQAHKSITDPKFYPDFYVAGSKITEMAFRKIIAEESQIIAEKGQTNLPKVTIPPLRMFFEKQSRVLPP
jgi:internalin A